MKLYGSKGYFIWALSAVITVLGYIVSPLPAEQPVSGKIIVVDAGHGGVDSGANRLGVVEKEINLAIALQLRDALKAHGAKVILTRDTDTELSELCDNEQVRGRYHRDLNARVEMIQESDADLFISIHANTSFKQQKKGIECYYSNKIENSKKLALAIQERLGTIAPVSQGAEPARFFVLRRNTVPAVLVEVGYITNPEERANLQSPEYQGKLAQEIAAGVTNYYQQAIGPL